MTSLRILLHRFVVLLSRRNADAELDDEIHAHLALLKADYERRGLTPEDARHAALRAFGGVEQMKEIYRDHAVYAGAFLKTFLESYVVDDKFEVDAILDGTAVHIDGLCDVIVKGTRVYAGSWVFDPTSVHDDGAFAPFVVLVRRIATHADELLVGILGDNRCERDIALRVQPGQVIQQSFAGMAHLAEDPELAGFRGQLFDERALGCAILRHERANDDVRAIAQLLGPARHVRQGRVLQGGDLVRAWHGELQGWFARQCPVPGPCRC